MSIAIHQLVAVAWLALIALAVIEAVHAAVHAMRWLRRVEWGPVLVTGYLTLKPLAIAAGCGYLLSSVVIAKEPAGCHSLRALPIEDYSPLFLILAAGRSVPPWHPQQSPPRP